MKPTITLTQAAYDAMRDELELLRGQNRLLKHQLAAAEAMLRRSRSLAQQAARQAPKGR